MRYGAIFAGVFIITATASLASAAPLDEAERLGNEITNLRALPFGFAAWCDSGTLRMKRNGSVGFRVSDSAVCRLVPDGDFVCTADPHRAAQPDGAPVAPCHGLEAPESGNAI